MNFPTLHEFKYNDRQIKFIITDPNDTIQAAILRDGFYERVELNKIREACSENIRILDVGANIGNHAVYFSKVLGANLVTVIEPHPVALTHLKCNLAINAIENVDTSYMGIALGAGLSGGTIGNSFAGNLGSSQVVSGSSFPVIPGDVLFAKHDFDLIKIDVEGGELAVLRGLSEVMRRCRPTLLIEIHDSNLEDFAKWRGRMNYSIIWRHRRYKDNENFLLRANQ